MRGGEKTLLGPQLSVALPELSASQRASGGARMTVVATFPSRGVAARQGRNWAADAAVFVGAAVLLWLIVRVGRGTTVPWTVPSAPSSVSTDPSHLPYYAARSLLRMFAALGLSLAFTFLYATAAARSRRAEKVLIPLLDILQSVPILGFLAITITGFIALFPGSLLGLECASIFAIFTSQAWNMTFALYQSLIAQPHDLDEASRSDRAGRSRHCVEQQSRPDPGRTAHRARASPRSPFAII
jgi:NitT/TauT family transport system permease protein